MPAQRGQALEQIAHGYDAHLGRAGWGSIVARWGWVAGAGILQARRRWCSDMPTNVCSLCGDEHDPRMGRCPGGFEPSLPRRRRVGVPRIEWGVAAL